jgi:hypothetical protein
LIAKDTANCYRDVYAFVSSPDKECPVFAPFLTARLALGVRLSHIVDSAERANRVRHIYAP